MIVQHVINFGVGVRVVQLEELSCQSCCCQIEFQLCHQKVFSLLLVFLKVYVASAIYWLAPCTGLAVPSVCNHGTCDQVWRACPETAFLRVS